MCPRMRACWRGFRRVFEQIGKEPFHEHRIELHSGDLFVFGGPSRLAHHGVPRVRPGTAPPWLGLAGRLNISAKTVATYKYRLFEKLNVDNVVTLSQLASQHGLMEAVARQFARA